MNKEGESVPNHPLEESLTLEFAFKGSTEERERERE